MADLMNQIAAQVSHSVDLQKLANSIARGESDEYDELAKTIRAILLEYDSIPTKKLLNELIKEITSQISDTVTDVSDSILSQVDDVIREEINFQYAVLKAISSKRPTKPKLDAVSKAILNKPLVLNGKGYTWEERIGAFSNRHVAAVKQVIQAGWASGATGAEMAQQIIGTKTQPGIIKTSRSDANSLVKDLISHSSSMTKAEVARQNDDIIVGERCVVTLDGRTSPICQDLGSQDNGGKKFLYADVGRNFKRAPYHVRCRTVMIFIVAEEYDLELETTRPAVVDGKAIQVDQSTNWLDLAKRYPSVAEQALGTTRAKLLDDMTAKEFNSVAYNSLNEYVTIDEMVANSKKVASLLK